MKSVVLTTTARFLLPLFILFSVFLLLRGHDAPGGGFVGGLVASSGFILFAMANGPETVRASMKVGFRPLIAGGLLIALTATVLPTLIGEPFFRAWWGKINLGFGSVKLGTPMLFDFGVYIVVFAISMAILLTFLEGWGDPA